MFKQDEIAAQGEQNLNVVEAQNVGATNRTEMGIESNESIAAAKLATEASRPYRETDAEIQGIKRMQEELGLTPKKLQQPGLNIDFKTVDKFIDGKYMQVVEMTIEELGSSLTQEGNYYIPQGVDDEAKAGGISRLKEQYRGTTREKFIIKSMKQMNRNEKIDYIGQVSETFGIIPSRAMQSLTSH